MPIKSFDRTIPFVQTDEGWQPLIQVRFLQPRTAKALTVALLFDTGADQICLHPNWMWFFTDLTDRHFKGVGGDDKGTLGKNTFGQIEFLGQTIDCNVGFANMEEKTWMAGVIGRECFKPFGFGFWESAHEIYVTSKP